MMLRAFVVSTPVCPEVETRSQGSVLHVQSLAAALAFSARHPLAYGYQVRIEWVPPRFFAVVNFDYFFGKIAFLTTFLPGLRGSEFRRRRVKNRA
jgi:hypothetical protein